MVAAYTRGLVPAPGIKTNVAVHPVSQPQPPHPTSTAAVLRQATDRAARPSPPQPRRHRWCPESEIGRVFAERKVVSDVRRRRGAYWLYVSADGGVRREQLSGNAVEFL